LRIEDSAGAPLGSRVDEAASKWRMRKNFLQFQEPEASVWGLLDSLELPKHGESQVEI
jgi:hypothetical protein